MSMLSLLTFLLGVGLASSYVVWIAYKTHKPRRVDYSFKFKDELIDFTKRKPMISPFVNENKKEA